MWLLLLLLRGAYHVDLFQVLEELFLLRDRFCLGLLLGRRTGRLQRDMRVGRVRGQKHVYMVSGSPRLSSIYEHGAVIAPKEAGGVLRFMVASAYVVRWVFTRKPVLLRARPFITASSRAFPFQTTFARVAEEEIEKATKQKELA